MTLEQHSRDIIKDALMAHYKNHHEGPDVVFARKFGLNNSVFNRVKHGHNGKNIIDDGTWVKIGRQLNVNLSGAIAWEVVKTETFEALVEYMDQCKNESIAQLFCDRADLGKTVTGKWFALHRPNVYYIDCSLVKTKREFIKELAKKVGVNSIGNIKTIVEDIDYMLHAINKPLIILDEAGDLSYEAWCEIKSLWNLGEGYVGWFMMGADGLKKKIERNKANNKVGYAEIFRRFGSEYLRVSPENNPLAEKQFMMQQAMHVLEKNLPGAKLDEVLPKGNLSMTRMMQNIIKKKKKGVTTPNLFTSKKKATA